MQTEKSELTHFSEIAEKVSCSKDVKGASEYILDAISSLTSCSKIVVGAIEKKQQKQFYFLANRGLSFLLEYMEENYPYQEKNGKNHLYFTGLPSYIRDILYSERPFHDKDISDKTEDRRLKDMLHKNNISSLYIIPLKSCSFLNGFMGFAFEGGQKPSENDVKIFNILSTFLSQSMSVNSLNIEIELIIEKLRESIISIEKISHNLYKNRGIEVFLKTIAEDMTKLTLSDGCLILIDDKNSGISTLESKGDNEKLALCLGFIKKNENSEVRNFDMSSLPNQFREKGIRSLAYEKLKKDGNEIGYIVMYNSPRYYDDVRILGIFSTQIVLALYMYLNNRKLLETSILDRDLELISNQQKLIMEDELMRSDDVVEVDYLNIPYRYVGGDFCKFQKISDKRYFLFIADVMGHGIISNYFVAMLKGALNTILNITVSPSSIMNKLNRVLFKELDKLNIFITAKAILFDFENNRLFSSNAGHTLPIAIYKKENNHRRHEVIESESALALGILEDIVYQEEIKNIENLDLFAIYTDGIVEMKNSQGEEFGVERLIDYLKTQVALDSNQICSNLVKYLEKYMGDTKLADDITIVTVRKK